MMRVITWLLSIPLAAAIPPAPAAAQAFPPPVGDSGRRAYTPADVHFMAGTIYPHPQALLFAGGGQAHEAGTAVRTLCDRLVAHPENEMRPLSPPAGPRP